MALVDELEAQLVTSQAAAANLLDALVAELTGTVRRSPSIARASVGLDENSQSVERSAELDEYSKELRAKPTETTPPTRLKPEPSDAQALLALVRKRGSLSNSEAQVATGIDPATLRGLFKTLIDQGLVRTEGQRRGTRYISRIDTMNEAR
jgi:predicted HTH transcriptional regulator